MTEAATWPDVAMAAVIVFGFAAIVWALVWGSKK